MCDRHVERFSWAPRGRAPDLGAWPYAIPAVAQLIDAGGWEVPAGVTFLVGENGSGKSTLVEAFAAAYPRRGFETGNAPVAGAPPQPDDSPLRWHLRAVTHPLASPAGFFLRSELLQDHLRRADASTAAGRLSDDGQPLVARSHGEAVLSLLRTHFTEPGVYFLDEPEAGLSFTAMLGLVSVLDDMARAGCQVVVATHSPLLAALPGATLFELGEWGMQSTAWEQLQLVESWRRYLTDPASFLRHLLPSECPGEA